MELKTSTTFSGEQQTLCCPVCGEEWTHIERVEVFACGEEINAETHVSVSCTNDYRSSAGVVLIDGDVSGNTSRRRGSVHLTLSCECCRKDSTIAFSQHKGNTFIDILNVR